MQTAEVTLCRYDKLQVKEQDNHHSAPRLVLQVIVCESIWYIHFTVWSVMDFRNALLLTLNYVVRCDTIIVRPITTWNEVCTRLFVTRMRWATEFLSSTLTNKSTSGVKPYDDACRLASSVAKSNPESSQRGSITGQPPSAVTMPLNDSSSRSSIAASHNTSN